MGPLKRLPSKLKAIKSWFKIFDINHEFKNKPKGQHKQCAQAYDPDAMFPDVYVFRLEQNKTSQISL